jgi:hypothetical protein
VPQRRAYTTFQNGKMSGPMLPYNPQLDIAGVGVRWQGLLVSPTKPAWLAPPAVPPDAKYAWWPRLRDVECSWVANAREGDRFVYYDGPTLAAALVRPRLDAGRLAWTTLDELARFRRDPTGGRRDALYVEVRGGRARGGAIVDPVLDFNYEGSLAMTDLPKLEGPAVEAALLDICRARGLTASEAAGLLACWRKPFFETDGRRFLLVLSAVDYDTALPLTVRPAATEMVRVGIVLTEFAQ